MYSVYKTFNSVLDVVTGFDLNSRLEKVLEMDSWDREKIENYQREKFDKLKFFAVRADIYKNYSGTEHDGFPKFSKEFLQANIERFKTNFRKPYKTVHTSGSTGFPKKIFVSKEMLLAKRTSRLKMLSWYHLCREDKEVYIGGLAQPFSTRVYYFFKNKVYLPSNDLNGRRAVEYIQIINKHRPKILYAYPYALDIILRYAEQFGKSLHQPHVIVTLGENLYPEIRDHIQSHFPGTSLVNEYWSTEANIGVTCPEGKIHADEDTIIIETDGTNDKGCGDIRITNFYSYDLPVIRYDLGDRIRLSDKFCTCGRKTRIIENIEGRTVDYYYLKDGRRIAYMDMRIARFVENVVYFQIIHHRKDDSFLFQYVPKESGRSFDQSGLYHFFKKNLGVELYFKETDHIPPEPSGKYRVYKSV